MIYNLENEKQGIQLGKVMDSLKKEELDKKKLLVLPVYLPTTFLTIRKGKLQSPTNFWKLYMTNII